MVKKNVTIAMTGGHVTPGLAVVSEIRRLHPEWRILWIGRRTALEGITVESEEYRLVTKQGIRFFTLTTGRFTRLWSIRTLFSLIKIPIGYAAALFWLARVRPAIIVSFGGYIALPVVTAGAMLGIPSLTHEQTLAPGLTNRIIAGLVDRICVSFPETRARFAKGKTVVTGLPIRGELLAAAKPLRLTQTESLPVVYITGGSTGAVSLNTVVFPLVTHLTEIYTVIHQTGHPSFTQAMRVRDELPMAQKERYRIAPFFDIEDLAGILSRARIVIARAGANTVGELAALGKVAILVPLPWSAGGEQKANALWLAQNGGSVVLDQQGLTDEAMERAIHEMMANYVRYQERAKRLVRTFPRDGSERLVEEIEQIVSSI